MKKGVGRGVGWVGEVDVHPSGGILWWRVEYIYFCRLPGPHLS